MPETITENHDPFARFRKSINGHLRKDRDATNQSTRMSSDFSRIKITSSNEGGCGIEHIEPIDDDGQHRVYAFVFMPDGSGVLISGFRHFTDNEESLKVVSQRPIEPGSFLEDMADSMLQKYDQIPPEA